MASGRPSPSGLPGWAHAARRWSRQWHAKANWTNTRLAEAGYDVCDQCPLCGEARDTIHHRLWRCAAGDAARREAASGDDIRTLGAMRDDDPLATRGVFPHPAALAPLPACEPGVRVTVHERDPWGAPLQRAAVLDEVALDCAVYPDGAQFPNPVKDLSRAGWSVVGRDVLGLTYAVVQGPVWGRPPPDAAGRRVPGGHQRRPCPGGRRADLPGLPDRRAGPRQGLPQPGR